jgi:hypothetical protein
MARHVAFLKNRASWPGFSRPSTSSIRLNSWGVDARNTFAKTRFALLSGHDADYFNGLLTKP